VTALEVVPGKIISGSSDCTIKVWDQEKYTCLHIFKPKLPICGLTFKEERLFSLCLINGSVDVWNLRTEKHCYTIQEPSAESPPYYGLSFVNGKLYTGCIQGGIQVRDFAACNDVVLKELISMLKNGTDKDGEEAMERLNRMPKAVKVGVSLELDLVLGVNHTQQNELDAEDMILAIENYIKKHYTLVG
jgi:hypothetical protein